LQSRVEGRSGPSGVFSAYFSGQTTYSQYQPIIFPNTIYNSGDYSTATGAFTALITGLYVFHIHLVGCGAGYDYMGVRIQKASTLLGYVGIGWNSGSNAWNTGSATLIANIETGQQVTLDAYLAGSSGFCLYGGSDLGYNWFSGFLLEITI
jgi:hypothetical protein